MMVGRTEGKQQRNEHERTFGGDVCMFIFLIVEMFSSMYTYIKTYQIVHLKYV